LAIYPYPRGSKISSQQMGDKRYSTDMGQLRAKFNQDKGTVRILLLLSPT